MIENQTQTSPLTKSRTESPYLPCAGHVLSRRNQINQGWVVIYRAAAQGIDVGGDKYAVVCETHHTILGATNLQSARPLLLFPEFCADCMAELQQPTVSI